MYGGLDIWTLQCKPHGCLMGGGPQVHADEPEGPGGLGLRLLPGRPHT